MKNKRSRSMTNQQLITKYGIKFTKLYLSGLSVEKCALLLNISRWHAFVLKRSLNIHQERWQRVGMPEKFSKTTRSLIFGTLLGDSSIHMSGGNKYEVFSLSHSPKQLKYLKYIRKLLKELCPYEIKSLNDKWGTFRFVSPPHPELKEIRQIFYHNGIKQVSKDILLELTPQAIALWFMDDGSLTSINKNSGKGHGFSIATCSFDKRSIKNIIEYFKKQWNIIFTVSGKKYPKIYCFSKDALKFKQLIEPYIISSMKYKLKLTKLTGTGKSNKNNKQWKKWELNYLINNYIPYKMGIIQKISKKLDRSISSIANKIRSIKKNNII